MGSLSWLWLWVLVWMLGQLRSVWIAVPQMSSRLHKDLRVVAVLMVVVDAKRIL